MNIDELHPCAGCGFLCLANRQFCRKCEHEIMHNAPIQTTQLQKCSGCDNMCDIGFQYCTDCEYEIALEDWLDQADEDDCD